MKKIFTLVFSFGLLTSAFAQSENRKRSQAPGDNHQSSQYSQGKSYNKSSSNTYSYGQNSQWNKNDGHDQSAFNGDEKRFDRYKKIGDRDAHFDSRDRKDGRDYDYAPPVIRVPLLQIILGIGRK